MHVMRASRVGPVYGSVGANVGHASCSSRGDTRMVHAPQSGHVHGEGGGRGGRGGDSIAARSAPPPVPPNKPLFIARRQHSLSRCASPWGVVSTSRQTLRFHHGGGGGNPSAAAFGRVWLASRGGGPSLGAALRCPLAAGGGLHLGKLRGGTARDLGNAERGQLGLELLQLLHEVGLVLGAQLMNLQLRHPAIV